MKITKHNYPVCKTNTKKCSKLNNTYNICLECKIKEIMIETIDNEKYYVPRPDCPYWNPDDVFNHYKEEHYPYGYIKKDDFIYDTEYLEEERDIKRHAILLDKHKKSQIDFITLNENITAHGNRLKMLVKSGQMNLDGFDNDMLSGIKVILRAENNEIMIEYYGIVLIEETDEEIIERLNACEVGL